MAASSSYSPQLKYQVFLSFRGEDTRLNFTGHLLKALKDTGMNVFFDEEKLEKGEQLSLALSQAIAASSLWIIVLSADYASSKSCLAELSDIMDRKHSQEHIVLPIFYHVDPSDVRNLSGRFKTSFEEHESNRPLDEVKRWKAAFVEIGKIKGRHIDGGKFDRSDTEYIHDVVQYVMEKLNNKSSSVSEELVGIEYEKKMIMNLIEQGNGRIIGLWGMGVSEVCIDTPSILSTFIRERLNNIKAIVVLDDVNDSDQIDVMGVKYLGDGSKTVVTSRDRQVLKNGGADKIDEVKKLNVIDSLRLFSTFAFNLLNPTVDFQDLSYKFVQYAQGSPLALKVLGYKPYKKCRKDWESEDLVNLKVLRELSNHEFAT
ncbi:TMV resistance protein N-like [Hibiscus syriacus]|uniref:TMV resistance protein N-like n=1 Tax=Hibiscus syriacus TaxID=106335 RepID=UPI00192499F7|nr:TMV resistance protein N-like [Hibiscus syriacus]